MFQKFNESEKNIIGETRDINTVSDLNVKLDVKIGSVNVTIGDLLNLSKENIFLLGKDENADFDILANGKKIAEGILIVIDGELAIKVTNILNK